MYQKNLAVLSELIENINITLILINSKNSLRSMEKIEKLLGNAVHICIQSQLEIQAEMRRSETAPKL